MKLLRVLHNASLISTTPFIRLFPFIKMNYIGKSTLLKYSCAFLFLLFAWASCDDNTDTFGSSVMPDSDVSEVTQAVYGAYANSVMVDSLMANSSVCYLGRVTDPETNSTTTCNFLAQFYSLSNYSFPPRDSLILRDGQIAADSVELKIYIKSYYGDSLNSIKIGVYELDSANILNPEASYYTNMDADKYLSRKSDAIRKELTFAVADLSLPDSIRYSTEYKYIRVKLPVSFGTKVMNKYYEHPEYFKSAYSFIKYVFPGFYVKTLSGNGTLVNVDESTLSVYFKYRMNGVEYDGVQRVAATEEVLQCNQVDNTNLDQLLNQSDVSFLKTPAGIFTEVSLPILDIYENHDRDSVNSAKIVFMRQNNNNIGSYNLSTPSTLLMVPKDEMESFFSSHKVPDSYKTYITNYDNTYNSYTFNNIANLVSYLKRVCDKGAGITENDSEVVRKAKITAWTNANPNWNKVLLVPVTTASSSTGTITSVYHEFGLTSTRLVGGSNNAIRFSIVYSHFKY